MHEERAVFVVFVVGGVWTLKMDLDTLRSQYLPRTEVSANTSPPRDTQHTVLPAPRWRISSISRVDPFVLVEQPWSNLTYSGAWRCLRASLLLEMTSRG